MNWFSRILSVILINSEVHEQKKHTSIFAFLAYEPG